MTRWSESEQLQIPGAEIGLDQTGQEEEPPITETIREEVQKRREERQEASKDTIDISLITEQLQRQEITFTDAVEAVAELRERTWEELIDNHKESPRAELGYPDPDRPKEPTVSKIQFLQLVRTAQGKSELYKELQNPQYYEKFQALRLERLMEKLNLAEQGIIDEESIDQNIETYTGLKSRAAFRSLYKISKHFDTNSPVVEATSE